MRGRVPDERPMLEPFERLWPYEVTKMVELAGIEPASASLLRTVLHV
jgi:hypothetical protein